MSTPPEHDGSEESSAKLDAAVEALFCGNSKPLDELLEAEEPGGPRLGELLLELARKHGRPFVGLEKHAVVGAYRIIGEIGRGGMGAVYEAEHGVLRCRRALKVLYGQYGGKRDVDLFGDEVSTLARLHHPAIVTIHDTGETKTGERCFTMDLVDGVPFDAYVHDWQVPHRERLKMFAKICDAVAYAHQEKVIHRDLKPSNILVDNEANPRILDFGLARVTDGDVAFATTTAERNEIEDAAETSQVIGTLSYMSPEQTRGNPDEIDERSDVYSLGVILYELLTEQLPYELGGLSRGEAIRVIREQAPRRPRAVTPRLQRGLETAVLRALEKDPSRRFQKAGQLGAAIQKYVSPVPRWLRVSVAAGVLLLVMMGLGYGIWKHDAAITMARREVVRIQWDAEAGRAQSARGRAQALVKQYPGLTEAHLALARAESELGSR